MEQLKSANSRMAFLLKNKFQQKIKPVQTDTQISITMLHKSPCLFIMEYEMYLPWLYCRTWTGKKPSQREPLAPENNNHNISQCILSNIVHFREQNHQSNPSLKIPYE